ncbi:hypothetical protein J2Y63_005314 [Shinella sp. BE166]|uniref:hypothetical protein n=1 Tax=Shinella sp. BE166 TaxID=3373918 RepID=UPI003EBF5CA6
MLQRTSGENSLKMRWGEEGQNFSAVYSRLGIAAIQCEIMKKYFSGACKNRTHRNLWSEAGMAVGSAIPPFTLKEEARHPRSLMPNPLMRSRTVL